MRRKETDKNRKRTEKSRVEALSIKFNFIPEANYVKALTGAFRDLHHDITNRAYEDGTAAIAVIVERDNDRIIVANSGDQRAVLVRKYSAIALTTDHKPDEPNEKVRIYDVGGFVSEQKRVDGQLALSRALGDNELQPHVTYVPEVFVVDLLPEDKFLIVACDGLWDVVSNTKAMQIVNQYRTPSQAASALRDYAHQLGSSDNISVIVYCLDDSVSISDLELHVSPRGWVSSTGSGEMSAPHKASSNHQLSH